jgi:rod shape-determining protein MreB
LPANAERAARENLRQAMAGLFDRVIMIPEPFLAALGYRDESRLSDSAYVDPVRNSLFVDIGGGTTDVCMVQGYFPTAEDQISMPFAGDKVDALINEAIKKTYPDCSLSILKIRELKEQYSYVGKRENPIVVNVVVGGKMRKLDLTSQIGGACDELLQRILEAVKVLIARASSDSVTELMQNIVLTGGGSRIHGLDSELQRLWTAMAGHRFHSRMLAS